MVELAATIFSDGPSSNPDQPMKPLIRDWGTWLEQVILAFTSGAGNILKTSRAALFADLAHAADTTAWVMGDPTVAYNGIYVKSGASGTGSWARVSDLPFSFIIASDVGAGTPNAIQATTSIPVSGSALVWSNIFEANTASPVTISFNGGTALTIKTNAGNNVSVGGLVAGMIVLGTVSGSTFRLLSDQASAAVVAAAEGFANAAAASAAAAAASAAGVNLPSAVAGTYLRQKLDATGYETRTPAQVAGDLNVQQRNSIGGYSFDLAVTPTIPLAGGFTGAWGCQHRSGSSMTAPHSTPGVDGASYATVAFVRDSVGSGGNGPIYSDFAAFLSSSKTNYKTSSVGGEIDVVYMIGRQGQKDDLGGVLTDLEKVGGDTGGMVGNETALKWIDSAGTTVKRLQAILNYAGQGASFYSSTGTNGIGVWVEAQVGTYLSGFVCDQAGSATFENVIVATTGRSIGSIYYKVDNGGRTYGGNGSGASPAFSFMSDPNTGMGRIGEDQLGFSAGGTYRFYVDTGAFVPASDNAYSLGRTTTGRVSNIYTVNSPTVGSDERLKTDIVDSPLGLDFILAQRPVAYRLKEGGREIEWIEEEVEVEEIETTEIEVTKVQKFFDGEKVVTTEKKEIERVPVYGDPVQATDPVTGEPLFEDTNEPVIGDDGVPLVNVIPLEPTLVRDQDGNLSTIEQPPQIVPMTRAVRKPVMHAVPKKTLVKKIERRPIEKTREGIRQHAGLIAQEVKRAIDEANVRRLADGLEPVDFGGWVQDDMADPNSLQSLRYEQFVPILIKAVQELADEVRALRGGGRL
ncbi:tail fiber domain-containing protein [Sinorhizobium sp. GL28]|uniref:tail fiber domain-containing protein n=1 Tax=Sinorhizobium sp. GL28 TaxID=1358418 RepID=UPI00071CD97F|nr:tail fiber domain-containing protein [Sinorhizobium sp. GL28]KSV95369.1 hypothetical protein N184_00035 [Sinorhizobium sp. GL28]